MAYKVFVDTNVLLSGLFFEGNERRLLHRGLQGETALILSDDVTREAENVIRRKFRDSPGLEGALILFAAIKSRAQTVPPGAVEEHLERAAELVADAGDIPILAAALGTEIDALVTGDKELQEAGTSVPFEIMTTRETLEEIEG